MLKKTSVNELVQYLKAKTDEDVLLKSLAVSGEISNFRIAASNHAYFSLKDDKAKIDCVMFTNDLTNLTFKPKDGDQVIVIGSIKVFDKNATFNIYVKEIENVGLGNLYLEFEKNKKLLEQEGYFKIEHKQKIPMFPKKIAIISGKQSDALKDVITTINKRYKYARLVALQTLIQGKNAPQAIIEAINLVNSSDYDVIILARGGGSFEDLNVFNDLKLAKTIFNSKIPIITGIGHENDFTLADYVSDYRSSTPTQAGIIATPDTNEVLSKLVTNKKMINDYFNFKLNNNYQNLDNLYDSLTKNFNSILKNKMLYLNKIQQLLSKNDINNVLNMQRNKIMQQTILLENSFNNILISKKQNVIDNFNKLNINFEKLISIKKQKVNEMIIQLNLLDPNNITDKGYAIVYQNNKVIKKQSDLNLNDVVEVVSRQYKFKANIVEGDNDER